MLARARGPLLVGLALLSGCLADWARGPPPAIEYVVNMDAVREAFRATGRFNVTVPVDGTLWIAGREQRLGGNGTWSEIDESGGTVYHEDRSINMIGAVEGIGESYAALLLGDYGLYGFVGLPQGAKAREHHFDPYEVARGVFVQRVETRVADPPPGANWT